MRHLFVDTSQRSGDSVRFDSAQLHYLERVLRLEPGEAIDLVPRGGAEVWSARLEGGRRGLAGATVQTSRPVAPESRTVVRLFLSALKSDRLEWALQKTVELGVDSFFLLRARHSVKAPGQASGERMRSIAENACQQSGRHRLPELGGAIGLAEALERLGTEQGQGVALHPDGAAGLLRDYEPRQGLALSFFIGPEGGFAEEELEALRARGVSMARFDGNILRAETAAVAAATLLLARLGRL
ncbi:MAG: 16S rRNA (uracil(1498)-N(3))-methyltransferase [Candidatus Wallbacteria bacterium]|nr:16S rRNA (uracil(1498)-N(3))-methyltransferase [Candidatus Wallbacteria bacterium]